VLHVHVANQLGVKPERRIALCALDGLLARVQTDGKMRIKKKIDAINASNKIGLHLLQKPRINHIKPGKQRINHTPFVGGKVTGRRERRSTAGKVASERFLLCVRAHVHM
jgi:hypothetical protein